MWGGRGGVVLHVLHVVGGRRLTFSAATLGWLTAAGMRVVPEDYMKRAARFKVVQLHHPLHPRAAEQSGERYKGPAAC